jgi:hypothetical protein
MNSSWRRAVLFGAPAVAAIANVSHPVVIPPIYEAVLHHMPWWIVLHVANLVLFPAVGLAAYLLVRGREGRAASIARGAIACFVPLYAAFDSLAGIGTGVLVLNASRLSPSDPSAFGALLDAYWQDGVILAVGAGGSVAWVIAMLAAAVAFTVPQDRWRAGVAAVLILIVVGIARAALFQVPGVAAIQPAWWLVTLACGVVMALVARPRVPVALLTLAGALFGATHVTPTGPLGLGCFLAAAILLQRAREEDPRALRAAPRRKAA